MYRFRGSLAFLHLCSQAIEGGLQAAIGPRQHLIVPSYPQHHVLLTETDNISQVSLDAPAPGRAYLARAPCAAHKTTKLDQRHNLIRSETGTRSADTQSYKSDCLSLCMPSLLPSWPQHDVLVTASQAGSNQGGCRNSPKTMWVGSHLLTYARSVSM